MGKRNTWERISLNNHRLIKNVHVKEYGGKKFLYLDCSSCEEVPSLRNKRCMEEIRKAGKVDKVIFLKNYKRIYDLKTSKSLTLPKFAHILLLEPKGKLVERYQVRGAKIEIRKEDNVFYYVLYPEEAKLSPREIDELESSFENLSEKPENDILYRYSWGYGALELLFRDENIEDIYVDSPADMPVYVYHSKYEECRTNLILEENELARLSSKLRMLSGRPFDRAYPVIYADIPEYNVRATGITEPFTFKGTGFAFRKHRERPWTLSKLVKLKSMSPTQAAILSFLVEAESSILITGPRGAGKTSLLAALMLEIEPKYRILVMEDTKELPVEQMRKMGFNIQHLKLAVKGQEFEVEPEEALRAALRLGESVLVIGEVRGREAKVLFEAMRIGAAGNVVMGTIHGSSPYDTFDRIVNDLGVPRTSFKAVDYVVALGTRKEKGMRKRVLTGMWEVEKRWEEEPRFREVKISCLKPLGHKLGLKDVRGYIKRKEALIELLVRKGKTDVEHQVLANKLFRSGKSIRSLKRVL